MRLNNHAGIRPNVPLISIMFAVLFGAAILMFSSLFTPSARAQNATSTLTGTVIATSTSTSTSATSSTQTGNLSGTVSSSTSTTTPTDLQSLISQLLGLKNSYPSFASILQMFINSLLNGTATSTGTTTPPMSGNGYVEQNGWVVSAGGTIDFGGRNFSREQHILVTLNGMTVATAHADGGGNFSTGSIRLPTTPGTYTYVFTGQSGDTAQATVTVR